MANAGILRGLGLGPFIPPPIVSQAGGVGPTNGFVPQMDATQPGLLGLGTRAYNFNKQNVANVGGLFLNATTAPHAAIFSDQSAVTISTNVGASGGGIFQWDMGSAVWNVTSSQGLTNSALVSLSPTWNLNGQVTIMSGIVMSPTFGGITPPSASGRWVDITPAINTTGTWSEMVAFYSDPAIGSGVTVTNYYGMRIGVANGGTITTCYGLDIGVATVLGGTTIWGLVVGAYNSYFNGQTTFGGTGTPTWDIHVQGGNAATSGVGIDVSTTAPTSPASSASGVISIYKGATNWYYLITFNDAGATRYFYFKLNGTSTVTWTGGTGLPV